MVLVWVPALRLNDQVVPLEPNDFAEKPDILQLLLGGQLCNAQIDQESLLAWQPHAYELKVSALHGHRAIRRGLSGLDRRGRHGDVGGGLLDGGAHFGRRSLKQRCSLGGTLHDARCWGHVLGVHLVSALGVGAEGRLLVLVRELWQALGVIGDVVRVLLQSLVDQLHKVVIEGHTTGVSLLEVGLGLDLCFSHWMFGWHDLTQFGDYSVKNTEKK
mmetsp:Transcript_43940/g.71683  ORF Transcript_43940/g.71683 Transcript_43940/m.71683 type:complete len:216 (+) Transcript_43940:2421-3068(+)